MNKKLYIISNRLPVNIETVNGQVQVNVSSGGLISAVSSYLNYAGEKGSTGFDENIWIGTPCCSQAEWVQAKEGLVKSDFTYLPVFVNARLYNLYYNGFSNSVLWPLFHYFPSYAEYKIDYYESYSAANANFLDVVIRNAREGDTIWIHDYHLFPLAAMIREHLPSVTIGFFLHIPFPSYELFRLMPTQWQQGLLEGVLGTDLIGFHTIDYATHFLNCLQMVMGLGSENNIVTYKNRLVRVDVFPISIDFQKYHAAFSFKEVASLRSFYKQEFRDKKILFSVDRLDYTKGVFSRLKAYEWFLNLFPAYREKVVFIMVIVPSRDTIPKYAERKKEIDEFIGNINSRIGTITWKPVVYQYNQLSFEQLIALYTGCDLALITPLRDGMNLVAKEFVASRQDHKGVLLLSELTGAARELTDALLINPNDLDGLARKIKEGLEMSEAEQSRRLVRMQNRLIQYDVNTWAEDFFTQLANIKKRQTEFEFMFLGQDAKRLLYQDYHLASKRLLLLDYNGTLVPFSPLADQSEPGEEVLSLLANLSADQRNCIYLLSGRNSATLDNWFGLLRLNLVAGHGAKVKRHNEEWLVDRYIHQDDKWRELVMPVLDLSVKRCANTYIEEKEFSLVWHFSNAEPQQAKIRAGELYSELLQLTRNRNLQVVQGSYTVEVRNKGIGSGVLTRTLMSEKAYDFIMAFGDDSTDEEMFKELAGTPHAWTIKIGNEASYAKYNLYTPQMTLSLLNYLHTPV
ncbi:bifunctional alpha,alpha-trehalose-phosphate synthase (UDP-forming)/trehalose-phosphatase [Segetibacter sp. 3557_3]|uniref:bifunctional alpha,alpha-trehalose-phosphate synthase (UDP-forming)/trehalose-phosphatase n=1 Tax=Segetibacter sp. 3557_3 TaxID=2547429 RepID=UPI0010586A45|nr:bifunctional alpha,alpha-trehalose-phosphate synthase (UDP-forming)/trehalose-phosphatase [Segetibacter sp. 3557_3]TDH24586.1 bifunctional alpha,alpha-trehalose-phosphate synthase (UDP-forming)/trehalose-phosphatase [Segetibacter sp. 3557_3]